jgi:ABC-type Zn2+ transport system substrate-binding protein/surface adhesin
MAKIKMASVKKKEPAAVKQPEPNHTEKIKSQVLAKIGNPPRLHRVEVSNHHNGKYRVNIWEQPDPVKNLAVTVSARIRSSYYLKVSDAGEIIDSNPPLAKLECPD